jgi:MFS family permease
MQRYSPNTVRIADVESTKSADPRRVAVASAIGTTIEWYDFFIYGTAAAVVFGPQFFPQVSPLAGTLASFATFAVGFIARPLGGIVMGHFGDRIGRKSTLVWCLVLMGFSTFGIGVLPNYERIGVWAPLLLVFFRFVQGFALGGEWGGAVLMSVEHAPQSRRGLYGSFVALGLPAGIILSNLVFLLAAGSYLGISATGYLVIVYFISYATGNLQFPLGATLGLLQIAAIVFAASIVYFANQSDRIGKRRMMRWGSAALIFASLVFFPLIDTKSMKLAALSLCFMLLVQGVYIGPQAAVFAESFPAPVRYSGASLSITIGTIFGGAIAPFLATTLFGAAGNSRPITIYAVVLSIISWMCSLGLKETRIT